MLTILLLPAIIGTSASAALPKGAPLIPRQYDPSDPYKNWPSYAGLPLDASYPTKAAWGVWGSDDVHGALNHITPATIASAASEVRSGQSFNLNLELSFIPRPITPNRRPLVHLFQPESDYTDDVMTLNTQMSTQYDGLRHFAYNEGPNTSTWRYYNDLIGDYEEVIGHEDVRTSVLGIQQAADKGVAGRAVLLDYKGWMDERGEVFDPLTRWSVPISDLERVAEWQNLTGDWSRPGDILLIRFGWIAAFAQLNETQKQELVLGPGGSIGLTADDAAAEWLWDRKFALVGSDSPAFEASPLEGVFGGEERSFHQLLLSGWGTSILEFIDTERITPALRAAGRSTFFMTVQVLNVLGGIASPANAMGIM